jgi:hypothetical protein
MLFLPFDQLFFVPWHLEALYPFRYSSSATASDVPEMFYLSLSQDLSFSYIISIELQCPSFFCTLNQSYFSFSFSSWGSK